MKKTLSLLLVLFAVTLTLSAAVTGSGSAKLTAAVGNGFSVDAKADVSYTLKMPMLEGDGPLFSGNNLKVKAHVGVSPIAVTGSIDAVLTPIAIAEISLGGGAGTGWDLPLMSLEGLRLDSAGSLASDQLGGLYYFGRAGIALQFDTGAILSGDWSSVLVRAYHELNYQGYSNAEAAQPWEYETGGAAVNGFNCKGEYILAYQMPLPLNLVGAQFEWYINNVFDSDRSPLLYDVSALANIDIIDHLSLLVVGQFSNYQKKDKGTSELVLRDAVGFKRVAVIATYSF
ncbi:MAG TPA: hypothetical protein PLH14_04875 [Sphaerochaeta sp.]|nr:hypothetical protein [Sphaerochaeta sp.]